jgi:mRNA interferase RelE/StbE
MQATFRKSFTRDLKKVRDQAVLDSVRRAIEEVETATGLQGISHLPKMSGTSNYYRIRIGDYRIGIAVEEDRVDFIRCLPRRDLYRYFP